MNIRSFIVGSGRSGTTLLQSMIASHPEIHSFPETQFLNHSIRRRHELQVRLGIATGRESSILSRHLQQVDREDLLSMVSNQFWLSDAIQMFTDVLDRLAADNSASGWVEKTPEHLFRINLLERYVEHPHFVHIVRDGREVIASMKKQAQKYDFTQHNVDVYVKKWNKCARITQQHACNSNHHVIIYEHLVKEPERVMQCAFDFLGIPYDDAVVENREVGASLVVAEGQGWVEKVKRPLHTPDPKFPDLFDPGTQQHIEATLDLNTYNKLETYVRNHK